MRRRQRRLRAQWRHEQQTVAMVLATVGHHSFGPTANDALRSQKPVTSTREGVEHESYGGLRAQKPPLPEKRPGLPPEPEPQVRAATVGYVAAAGPLLVVASLAGGDEVDATTVSYLLKDALVKKKEEEERKVQERKEMVMRDIHRKIHANVEVSEAEWAAWRAWHGIGSSSSAGRRKRKKKRKKKLPKSSSSCGRARRRQRQWHVPGPCALQRQVPAVPRVHCVSLRHVVDVRVVRFVQFPQVLFFGFYADWINSNDEICADNYIYFRFKLKGKGRSEQWEVFLYGDKTIKVDRDSSEVLPRGVPPPGICGVHFGSSPNLATDHTIYELCLPSERGMGMSMNLADPVSSGKYCGTCVSTAPAAEPAVMSFTVTLTGSTIDATASVGTTCFASADCTNSATPMCNAGACVAMSCDGGSFTPDGAYDSLWVAMPMKGNTPSFTSSTKRTLGASACSMTVQQH